MKFSPQVRAWILLIALVVGTGASVTVTSYLGGAKLWVAILCGIATGATNVYHAVNSSPNEAAQQNETAAEKSP